MTIPSSGSPESRGEEFIGHFGTRLRVPPEWRLTRVAFGDEGDEVLFFEPAAKEGPPAFLRICSRMARRGYGAQRALEEQLSRARKAGVAPGTPSPRPIDERTWALDVNEKPAATVVARDAAEYVYLAMAPGISAAGGLLDAIRQTPRAEWDAMVVGMRQSRGDFIPNLKPPGEYSSPLGYTLTLRPGFTFHREGTPESEVVYVFPKRHGVLMSRDILTNGAEYRNFTVTSVQAARREGVGKSPRRFLEDAAEPYRRKYRLSDKDLGLSDGDGGHAVLERRKPTYLRYEAWEKDGVFFVVVGGSPLVSMSTVDSIR